MQNKIDAVRQDKHPKHTKTKKQTKQQKKKSLNIPTLQKVQTRLTTSSKEMGQLVKSSRNENNLETVKMLFTNKNITNERVS